MLERVSPALVLGSPRQRLDIRHIVVAGRDAHPSSANGVHNVARWLVREQRAAGHDARLLLLRYGQPPEQPGDDDSVRTVPITGIVIRGRIVQLRRDTLDRVLADADERTLFHIHGGREPLLVGLAYRLRTKKIPYVVTVHGRFSHVYDSAGHCLKRSTAFYLRLIEQGLLTGARFVHALSCNEEQVLRRIAPRATIEVVGNGAYSSRLGSAPVQPAARPPSAAYPHFVSCGRYAIHHKGLDLLLEGFAAYRRSGGSGHLTTIGSGSMRTELLRMADRLNIAQAVTIHGALFGHERDAILRSGDFFVMPSRFEGIPLAALEAALLGLPLLVTSETGLRDAVETHGAGIPIDALAAKSVCSAMRRAAALSPADWSAQCLSAYRLAVSIGNWTTIAERLCDLYRRRTQELIPVGARLPPMSRGPADGDPSRSC
jgi:glycosyltransferase involved in cell wall biosynthesis